jgi:ubiquinone/menaquinone biosynthesis C-methylase UbiE
MQNKGDNKKTGWGGVAKWYDKHLKDDDTYHAKVVTPNLLRLVDLTSTQSLLELGCGQGYFLEKFFAASKKLTGVDIGLELIKIAKTNNKNIEYLVASADDTTILKDKKFDVIIVVLALQNMKDLNKVVDNIDRLLEEKGRVYIVLNHPAFRVPQFSDWVFDTQRHLQSRRVDAYMSSLEIGIDMNPGKQDKKNMTKSFHRPLQVYSKSFARHNFAITKIEEWISHKESEKGPRQEAENKARKEFPMFMCLEFKKIT